MMAAQFDHLLSLFVAQSQCNPLLPENCDVDRLLMLYSFKKVVGTVGTREQCPLTRAMTGFLCSHQGHKVVGTGGNNLNTGPFCSHCSHLVPTIYRTRWEQL